MKRCCQIPGALKAVLRVAPLLMLFAICSTPAVAGLLNGEQAPAFDLRDQAGQACRLSDFEGQPLVLKIGTTWCPSCASQSKELVKALPALQELGVAVVEVFVEDTPAAVTEFRSKHHLPEAIKTCLDSEGQVLGGYKVVSIPRVLLLDAEHSVLSDQYLIPAQRIEQRFRKLAE